MGEYTRWTGIKIFKSLFVMFGLLLYVTPLKAQVYYSTGLTKTQKTFFQKLYSAVLTDYNLHKNAKVTTVSKASSKPAKPVLSKLMAAFVDTASIKSLPEFSAAMSPEDVYQSQMMTVHCSNLMQKGIGCFPSKILFVMPVNDYGKIEGDEEYYKGNENMLLAGIYKGKYYYPFLIIRIADDGKKIAYMSPVINFETPKKEKTAFFDKNLKQFYDRCFDGSNGREANYMQEEATADTATVVH